jgi:threonine/homoserine/homoserine lactone efflux protein
VCSLRALLLALIVGLCLGFFGSMPIAGPVGVVVVAKGLESKYRSGAYIALSAAVAEGGYAFMAFWGLTSIMGRYPVLAPASRLLGCAIAVALGVYFLVRRSKPSSKSAEVKEAGKYRDALFGFSITALNPTLLVTWTAAVSAAHSIGILRVHAMDAIPFAGGVVIGIATWFMTLLWLLSRFRNVATSTTLDWVLRGMGVVLVLVGTGLAIRLAVRWHNDGPPQPVSKGAAGTVEADATN